MTKSPGLRFAGETNCGLVRERNEDCFCFAAESGAPAALATVADGIGGHRDGQLASFYCCASLLSAWREAAATTGDAPSAVRFLDDELCRINAALFAENRRDRCARPMGTTVAAAVFLADSLITAHAGDSRIYRWSPEDQLEQLTRDHTLLAELADAGAPGCRAAELANVISRAVGPRHCFEPEIHRFARRPTDRFLLCSDGLSRYVPDDRIGATLAAAADSREALDRLMRAALIAGGPDNITIVCAFPSGSAAQAKGEFPCPSV